MKINYRQLSILVFMSFVALKFLALPSLLYLESENMSWLVALVLMLIDAVYVFLFLDLMKKNKETNILDLMKSCLGPVISRIFLIILALKYAMVVANISKGLEFFVIENFYNRLNWFVFVLPLILLIGFMVYKGVRNVARVCELICWPIILGCLYIAVKSVMGIEPLNFLPLFKDGAVPLFKSGFMHLSWFGSSTFMFMLFGKVDFSKEKRITMFKYIAVAVLLVQLIYFIFYGLFDVTSPLHNFCISDISQFSSGQSSIDELSWLVVSLWVTAQAVQLALFGYCLVQTVKLTFNIKNDTFPILFLLLFILLWSYVGEITVRLERIFYSPYASILTIISAYILPLILFIGAGIQSLKNKHNKNGDKTLDKHTGLATNSKSTKLEKQKTKSKGAQAGKQLRGEK